MFKGREPLFETGTESTGSGRGPLSRAAGVLGDRGMQDPAPRDFRDGASRDRTGDLLLAKQALSHLSYGPAGASSLAAVAFSLPSSDGVRIVKIGGAAVDTSTA